MADPHDALARFRAVADAAVEQGRRAVGEARESGAAFDREARRLTQRPHDQDHGRAEADLRAAAKDFRARAGLPVPDAPGARPADAASEFAGPDDEDFSQLRILRKL
ncbi:MAG TPA: hypothetical protein VFM37_05920 [Pseudonocardiaceae bacterium]|nr:hypothetical protein [Pseudonocardiaceae bacterium]